MAGVSLVGGKLAATRDVKGMLDLANLVCRAGAANGARRRNRQVPKLPRPSTPWKIGVREIKLADWSARFTDQGFAKPLSATAEGFGLTAALTGEVGATTVIEVGPVNAALGPIRVQSGSQPVAELQRAALVNAGMKLAENRLDHRGAGTERCQNQRDAGQAKSPQLDRHPEKGARRACRCAGQAGHETAVKPLDVQLARLSLDGIEVDIVDQSPAKPVRLDVVEGFVTLKDLQPWT